MQQAVRVQRQFLAPAKAQPAARRQLTVCAAAPRPEVSPRRVALALLAAAAMGVNAPNAHAVHAAKNSSTASASGYSLEGTTGTKKLGISAKEKLELLKEVREAALKVAAAK